MSEKPSAKPQSQGSLQPDGSGADVASDRDAMILKGIIVRIMSRCGSGDAWKKNEYPNLSNAIIELSNLLDRPFTTGEAIEVAKQIGVAL